MKAVFLDTNVFYNINFNIDDPKMVEFLRLTERLDIERWITPITIEEIKSGINRKIDDLKSAYSKANGILKNSFDDNELLNISDVEKARCGALTEIEEFIKQSNFKIINYSELDDGDISKIFSDYFKQEGSFSPKRRSKNKISKEFPDAFQIEMIRASTRCGEKVAIVSDDIDFEEALVHESYIERFKSIDSLNKVLNKMPDRNCEYLTKIENEIYYMLEPYSTFDKVFSELVQTNPYSSEGDAKDALNSLCEKGLLKLTDKNNILSPTSR